MPKAYARARKRPLKDMLTRGTGGAVGPPPISRAPAPKPTGGMELRPGRVPTRPIVPAGSYRDRSAMRRRGR
jgi:hypothetical protein